MFLEVKFSIYLNRRVFVMLPIERTAKTDQTGRMEVHADLSLRWAHVPFC